jgi:hypothetical protein
MRSRARWKKTQTGVRRRFSRSKNSPPSASTVCVSCSNSWAINQAADLVERLGLGLAQRHGDLGDKLAGGGWCRFAHTDSVAMEQIGVKPGFDDIPLTTNA